MTQVLPVEHEPVAEYSKSMQGGSSCSLLDSQRHAKENHELCGGALVHHDWLDMLYCCACVLISQSMALALALALVLFFSDALTLED